MIFPEKDPTLKSLLIQEALKARGLYSGELDNWFGPRSEDALEAFQRGMSPAEPATANKHRDINEAGRELIKHFEGYFPEAYKDPVGIWTIGSGHTGLKHRDGTVYAGRVISKEEGEKLFSHDMDFFEGRVEKYISVPLNDNEFAALVSFDFNTGGIADSTLRRKLNAGDRAGAALEFRRWDKAGGRTLRG